MKTAAVCSFTGFVGSTLSLVSEAAALAAFKALSLASCPGMKACAVCDKASPNVAKKKNTLNITWRRVVAGRLGEAQFVEEDGLQKG